MNGANPQIHRVNHQIPLTSSIIISEMDKPDPDLFTQITDQHKSYKIIILHCVISDIKLVISHPAN